jgi:hypothetical protein
VLLFAALCLCLATRTQAPVYERLWYQTPRRRFLREPAPHVALELYGSEREKVPIPKTVAADVLVSSITV